MSSKKKLREIYEAENKYGYFFTGGTVKWTKDGATLLCQCDGIISVFDIVKGDVTSTINKPEEGEIEDTVYTFALSEDDEKLVSSHKSGLLKLWSWREGSIIKVWKSVHKGHVVSLAFKKDGNMVVSGGTASGVRLWNLVNNSCIHSLRGAQGVISLVCFHSNEEVPLVFASGDDYAIRGWNIHTGKPAITLSAHYSKVTAIVFHNDNKHIVSCSRDKVIILWNLEKQESIKILPVFESLEGMVILRSPFSLPDNKNCFEDSLYVATAGERGVIRIWDVMLGREEFTQKNSLVSKPAEDATLCIADLLFCEAKKSFGVVSADQNIIFHNLETFECEKQLVGFYDEILDVVFVGEGNSHMAVATNSIDIKLYDISQMGCQLLKGHTDLVLGLASTTNNPDILLSCGKDNSVRLWLMDKEKIMQMIGVGMRHTSSVGSVAISNMSTSFFLSVSEDTCIKLWSFPKDLSKASSDLLVKKTQIAHDKDINCVCISPNDKMAATGSQDRTAKLWCTGTLALLGVLRGHKRGVWCVRFSPVDRVLLSSSADCSVKIWSLDDLSCLKTLEGHEASVLRAEFITHGTQIVSTGADGLLKLWFIKTSECLGTFDEHAGKIWALAVQDDGKALITGDSESILVKWRDMTKVRQMEKLQEQEEYILQEQKLSDLLHHDRLLAALKLALSLNRPRTVLQIIQTVMQKGGSDITKTIKDLSTEQKEELLKSAMAWNTNSKNSEAAQLVLSSLLGDLSTGALKPADFSGILEGVIPYTERHFKRLTKLSQDLYFLQYTLSCMNINSEKITNVISETNEQEISSE